MEFLRDSASTSPSTRMIKKDMVRDAEKESPLSFTEFSYPLLQGYDFLHLNEEYGCDVQVGGSDQWGNILAGVEFIRRKTERTFSPSPGRSSSTKRPAKNSAKSEQGAIWLDPEKTSPFQFYQFWLNIGRRDRRGISLENDVAFEAEIDAVMELQKRDKKEHHAQKLLARAVTTLVHGEQAAEEANAFRKCFSGRELLRIG